MSYYNRTYKRSLGDRLSDNFGVIFGSFIALIVLALAILIPVSTYNWVHSEHQYSNCVVTGKESINKDKTHEYRIYTDKCGVFQVSDELWLGLFNSADTYNTIQQGKTYDFKTVGWRNGFFSVFENIVEVR